MKFDSFIYKSYSGQSRSVDAERTVNLMLERVESGQGKNRFEYSFIRSPGLLTQFDSGIPSGVRGMLPLNGHVFAIIGSTVEDIIDTGLNATYGLVADDGKLAEMAANTTQLLIVSAAQTYVVGGGVLAPVNQFGAAIASIGYVNGYFLFLDFAGDGFYYSEPGDATTGTNLNFISAEADANKYVKLLVDRGEQIWLFGTRISQVFYDNSGNDPQNPFAPNLSAIIPWGIVAKDSAVTWGGRVGWLSKNKDGQGIAVATQGGYLPSRISNHAVEYIWSTYPTIADAVGYSITIKGHELWRLYFPSGDSTWEYDPLVDDWREVLWWDATFGQYHAHRVRCACSEFGTVLGGDRANGKIYKMSVDYLRDDTDRIRWMRRSPIVSNENKRIGFPWFEVDFQAGVGDGGNVDPLLGTVTPESDPMMDLRISTDWGENFGPARSRSMGRIGEYHKRAIWLRNGNSRQQVFELSGSAAVKTILNNVYLRNPSGRKT